MVILSAVIASVVSEIGLGSQPAFKVPDYDFRSPGGKSSRDSTSLLPYVALAHGYRFSALPYIPFLITCLFFGENKMEWK